jgi:hypothetical protein
MVAYHEEIVLDAIGGESVGHAGSADPARPHEHFQEVVEAGGRMVLDGGGAHDELALAHVALEEPEVTQVFDPGEVEVGEVAAVVDDALGVGIGEADARRRSLNGALR